MNLSTLHKLFCTVMATSAPLILAPIGVRGMKVLDRESFLRKIKIPVLKVSEENLSKISQVCRAYFLKLENFKPVQNCDKDDQFKKIYYLNPEKITKWDDIAETDRTHLIENKVTESNFTFKEIEFGYDNWSYDTIFKAVLPEKEEIVSSFSQIGHIIHLNLRDHLLEYRPLIGQVLVDKIKTCRTVVNKSNIIDNTYRNFSMEVIAGEENFLVTVNENNCKFHFDFSKVYWNPRLCKEHERILSLLKPGDILFDVFSGVGPFSIPAAKRKCRVFANDLNPESYKWLKHNADSNKIKKEYFTAYNLDGKDFIREIFRDFITDYCNGKIKVDSESTIHVTMNLPAVAVEFLKYFKNLIKEPTFIGTFNCKIIVYVYCFVSGDSILIAKELVNENFGWDMTSYIHEVFNVRKVSPKKNMMRVTLELKKDILFVSDEENQPLIKRKKTCVENTEL